MVDDHVGGIAPAGRQLDVVLVVRVLPLRVERSGAIVLGVAVEVPRRDAITLVTVGAVAADRCPKTFLLVGRGRRRVAEATGAQIVARATHRHGKDELGSRCTPQILPRRHGDLGEVLRSRLANRDLDLVAVQLLDADDRAIDAVGVAVLGRRGAGHGVPLRTGLSPHHAGERGRVSGALHLLSLRVPRPEVGCEGGHDHERDHEQSHHGEDVAGIVRGGVLGTSGSCPSRLGTQLYDA